MTLTLIGALIGGLLAAGLLLAVLSTPALRKVTLADRIAPYLADTTSVSRLLQAPGGGTVTALGRLTAPLMRDAVRLVDRVLGGRASVRRRLDALGESTTVEQFRAEQVLWGAIGAGAGVVIGLLAILVGQSSALIVVVLVVGCTLGGVFARDWWLGQTVARRDAEIIAEFPVVAEMLALAVTAGEGPIGAIDRISRLAHGHLVAQLGGILADTRSGTPFLVAITALRDRTRLEPLSRFLDGMAVAIDRGTPLADVLRAQAADVRALSKRQLLESGGRKEIAMMVPVKMRP